MNRPLIVLFYTVLILISFLGNVSADAACAVNAAGCTSGFPSNSQETHPAKNCDTCLAYHVPEIASVLSPFTFTLSLNTPALSIVSFTFAPSVRPPIAR